MSDIEIRQKQREVLERIRRRTTSITYSRYAIVLLLDISGSMSGVKIEDAKKALTHFLKSINLAENEVGLVAFGERIRKTELSQDCTHLETKIESFEAGGGTPMMNAIKTAYEDLLKKRVSPVMVIATDGQPTDAPEGEILEYAIPIKKKGVRIITIGIGKDVNENFLKRLASSPEDYHFAKASFELKKIYKEVADILALPGKQTDYLKGV
ncbi:hypothetical protein ES707_20614 [subsurface metagenome]